MFTNKGLLWLDVITQTVILKLRGIRSFKSASAIYQVQGQPGLHEILPTKVNPKTRDYYYHGTSI